MKNIKIGFIILFITFVWAFVETAYFDFNVFPGSKAELICDCIGYISLVIGGFLIIKGLKLEKRKRRNAENN